MKDCFEKAKEILVQCAVDPESYTHLAAMHKGGGCTLTFNSHGHLQIARQKLITAALSFAVDPRDNRKIMVFLDAAKTKEELRPALYTHRAFDILTEFEQSMPDEKVIIKDMRGKCVKIAATRIGFSLYGEWRWTPMAVSRYDESQLDAATAYIQGS